MCSSDLTPEVLSLRRRQIRNFLTTLFLSQGVPMLLGGDELGRTQRGNNNGYCQDNGLSWYDWPSADRRLLVFTQRLIQLRHRHPVFCRRRWFHGRAIHGSGVSDIGWFPPGGVEMSEEDWQRAGWHTEHGLYTPTTWLQIYAVHAHNHAGQIARLKAALTK